MIKLLILLEDRHSLGYYGPSNISVDMYNILVKNYKTKLKINNFDPNKSLWKNLNIVGISRFKNSLKCIKNSDIINLHYMRGFNYILYAFAAQIMKKPSIMHIYFPLDKKIINLTKNRVNKFIALNYYMAEYLKEYGIDERKISIVPPPIDTERFQRTEISYLKEKYSIPENKFIITYHGRPSKIRGLDLFLKIIPKLKKEEKNLFVILSLADVKEDMDINEIMTFIKKEKLENYIKILIGKNNPSEIYNLSNIILFPFLGKNASICPPLSVLEAMSSETVVLTTNIEELGLNHIIADGENGFLASPNETSILSKINSIKELDDYELKIIKKSARQKILEEYSYPIISDKMKEIIDFI